MIRKMSRQEEQARACCLTYGKDPDEIVAGYWLDAGGSRNRITAPRWSWYVGASPWPSEDRKGRA